MPVNHQLTRAEMEAAIKRGESVRVSGKKYTRVEDLPAEADLAAGDETRLDAEEARLKGEIARHQAELDNLSRQREAQKAQRQTAAKAESQQAEAKGEDAKADEPKPAPKHHRGHKAHDDEKGDK